MSTAGVPADDAGLPDDMSSNGRYITFTSLATNLVAGDTNGVDDVFLRDRVAGTTRLVSTSGAPANAPSYGGSVSDDGRYVAFTSSASNLAGGAGGVFLRDMTTGSLTRIALGGSAVLSANGRFVAYATGLQTRRWDRTTRTSVAVNSGGSPQISGSGRFVVTFRYGTDDQPTYLFSDLAAGTTRDLWARAKTSPDHGWWNEPGRPVLSTSGRFVAFATDATGFHPADVPFTDELYLVDTGDGDRYLRPTADLEVNAYGASLAISGDGRVLTFNLFDQTVGELNQLVAFDRVTKLVSYVDEAFDATSVLDYTGRRAAFGGDGYTIRTGTVPRCTIDGTAGNDTLTGTPGPDVICGRGGNDVIQGRGGHDILAGGPGTDTLSFTRSNSRVAVRMYGWYARGAGEDEIYAFENVDGSDHDDLIIGDHRANRLRGLAGDDVLWGHGADDVLVGGAGYDTCRAGDGVADTAIACEIVRGVP